MSHNYTQQGGPFDDCRDDPTSNLALHYTQHQNQHQPQFPHHAIIPTVVTHSPNQQLRFRNQYPDNRQYGMQQQQQQQQQGQYAYQSHQSQPYSYHQQNFLQQQQKQQLIPVPPYAGMAKQPPTYSGNQLPLHPHPPPPPSFSLSPIQPHQNHRATQEQLQRPTDPRNGNTLSQLGHNNNKVPLSKKNKGKKAEKRGANAAEKNFKKEEMKIAARASNPNLDTLLAEFIKAFNVSEYNRFAKSRGMDKYSTKAGNIILRDEGKICLAFHCMGHCSNKCSKNESHRQLTVCERQMFYDYLARIKTRLVEEKNNPKKKKKKAKKGTPAYDKEEVLDEKIVNVPTPDTGEKKFDKNNCMDKALAYFGKTFKVPEYQRYAKKFGMKIPQHRNLFAGSFEGPMCLTYHCMGKCSKRCNSKESHLPLLDDDRNRLHDYLVYLSRRILDESSGKNTTFDKGVNECEAECQLPDQLPNSTETVSRAEKTTEGGKRKVDDSGVDCEQSDEKKRQKLGRDDDDGRFDDCSDADEVQVLGTLLVTTVANTRYLDNDGTAGNPVDLTDSATPTDDSISNLADSITPMTRALYSGLPGSNYHQTEPNSDSPLVVVSLTSSVDLDQRSNTTSLSVPTGSSDDDVIVEQTTHQELPTDYSINDTAGARVASSKPSSTEIVDQGGDVLELSLSVSSEDEPVGNRSNKESEKPNNRSQVDQTNPPEPPPKEVLSPKSKSRKLKKLRVQLELAKRQHELAKLKEGLRKKEGLQKQRSQDFIRPISALSATLIIDNLHESGPENMVYFPNSELGHDLRLTEYKAILYGEKEKEEANETLSARKIQIERDLAILKERLESSFPTVEAASMNREDLQRKLGEAQANKDLSYWKLFVSKQEHILSNVENQIQDNSSSLTQCTEEMENVERGSKESIKTTTVLKIQEAALAKMAAESSTMILQMRQQLHKEQTKVDG